jgi:hypothetical protein
MVRGYQYKLLDAEQIQTINEHEHQDHIMLERDDEYSVEFGEIWWDFFCKLCDAPLASVPENTKHYALWMVESGHG